jgi:hypothetical protein
MNMSDLGSAPRGRVMKTIYAQYAEQLATEPFVTDVNEGRNGSILLNVSNHIVALMIAASWGRRYNVEMQHAPEDRVGDDAVEEYWWIRIWDHESA